MRIARYLAIAAVVVLVSGGFAGLYRLHGASTPASRMPAATPDIGVAPEYDTAHVYVAPDDFDRFVASLVATFGGSTSKKGEFTVTPTPSLTMSQLVLTP